MRVWVNGRLLDDPNEPVLSVTDHGVTVGDGVFEAVKVVDGRPFALTRHLERMSRSAAGLGLPAVPTDDVRRGIAAVLEDQHLPLGKLRITYTGGLAPLGSGRGDGPPTLVVAADVLQSPETEATAVSVPWPRNERGALAGLKTTSYAENVVALAYARERGGTEAVFANLAGHLCEGTGSNVCYVRRRRAADALAGVGLPGRDHPRAAAGVVRRPRGGRADRGARRRRGDPAGLDDPERPGRHQVRRTRPGRGAGDDPVPGGVGGSVSGKHRPLTR